MQDILLKVENLGKKYCKTLKHSMFYALQDVYQDLCDTNSHVSNLRDNEFWALKDANFKIESGECLGIIGPNGAGKSTLLKIINGIIKPDEGLVEIRGNMGALIEVGAGFHPMLTGRENIFVNGAIIGMTRNEISNKLEDIISFSELEEFIETPVKFYSSGMFVRLGFAVAASLQPNVLLIDEVLAVGDAAFQFRCIEHIRKLLNNGTAIVIVTHNLNLIPSLCDSAILVIKGKATPKASPSDAINQYKKYLREDQGRSGNQTKLETTTKQNEKLRSGNRNNLEILKYRMLDDAYQERNKFTINDNVVLEIVVKAKNDVERVGASFLVKDLTGEMLIGRTSHHEEVSLSIKANNKAIFRFKFKNILKPSAYSISLAANQLPVDGGISLGIADDQIDNALILESIPTPGYDVYTKIYMPVECEGHIV